MKNKKTYVIATIKDWHIKAFNENIDVSSKNWILINTPEDLTYENLIKHSPRYIFFPHWSWIVPEDIVNNFECVCFHSSDVPYGRGGSPIQNLIIRDIKETKISALRMIEELDAGPVYMKSSLSLEGKAQDIFEKSALIISDMMQWIVKHEPIAKEQEGTPIVFKRRKGNDNILPKEGELQLLYNHIRMLDAESYPSSYLDYGDFKIEFSEAHLVEDTLKAHVTIKKNIT